MIHELRVRNLATIADVTLQLGPGLNVLTGETGAGKSMLVDALALLLGERADSSTVRSGAGKALLARVSAAGLGGLRGSASTAHVSAVDENCPSDAQSRAVLTSRSIPRVLANSSSPVASMYRAVASAMSALMWNAAVPAGQ